AEREDDTHASTHAGLDREGDAAVRAALDADERDQPRAQRRAGGVRRRDAAAGVEAAPALPERVDVEARDALDALYAGECVRVRAALHPRTSDECEARVRARVEHYTHACLRAR